MDPSRFVCIEEHLKEQEECTRSVLWFGASSSCLAFMVTAAPQDGLTQHSVNTTLPPPFDLREAITLGYQNTMELVSEAAQEGHLDGSSFLNMLNLASEHVIEIPPRTVLLKVMEAIGAKAVPIFKCTPCGSLHFKVCVELDVSSTSFSFGKSPPVAKVEGELCDSPALAETSAISNAFKYLGQKHYIQVHDYSSSIIQMIHRLGYDGGDVDDLEYLMKKLIEQWDLSERCEKLAQHLDYKEILENNNGVITQAGQVYATLNDFITYIIKRYRSMPVYARSELEKIQDERLSTKHHNFLSQVHLHTVWFSVKDVLDYVLSYLGIGKAEYKSVLSDGGKVEGEVKFSFPYMVEGRCHILEVHSRAQASSRAEEVAARAALIFMESKFNVNIVDLNYAHRGTAEKKHKSLELIVYRVIEVAHQMKTYLGNMVECIAGGCAAYSGDPRSVFVGPLSQEQLVAVDFCFKSVEAIRADCATRYESSASVFQEIEKLSCRLE